MAECKECLHIDVCDLCGDCSSFKPKSRFIELPCVVGDTVYKIEKYTINPCIVEQIIIMDDMIPKIVYQDKIYHCRGMCSIEQFGETMFLTKEEAGLQEYKQAEV